MASHGNLTRLKRKQLVKIHKELVDVLSERVPEARDGLQFKQISKKDCSESKIVEANNDSATAAEDEDLFDITSIAGKLGLSVSTIRTAIAHGRIKTVKRDDCRSQVKQWISLAEARIVFASTLRFPPVPASDERAAGDDLMSLEKIAEITGVRLQLILYAARNNRFACYRDGRKLFARLSDVEPALVPDRLRGLYERKALLAEIHVMQLWLSNGDHDRSEQASASTSVAERRMR